MKVQKVSTSSLESYSPRQQEETNMTADYVKLLNDAGIENAEEVVEKITAKVNEACKGEKPDFIAAALDTKIKQYASKPKGDRFSGILVALGDIKDTNQYSKNMAIKAYNDNPTVALRKKMVQVVSGEVIPLDDKKFFDKAGKNPNPNYGKPLKTRLSRSGILLTEDNNLINVYGDFDAQLGAYVTLTGNYNKDKNIINVNTNGCKLGDEVDPSDVWKTLFAAGKKSSVAVSLSKVFGLKNNTVFMTTGVVAASRETSNGGAMLNISDETVDEELTAFSDSEEVKDNMLNVAPGNQVIIIGRTKSYVNRRGDDVFNAVITGVTVNPESSKLADTLKDIDIDDI